VWIVDPLDGTREYGEVPREDWAVHVALVIGGVPAAGAVALPARGVTLATRPAPPPPPAWTGPPRVVVSRSRPPAEATLIADALGGELVALGSAGAKTMAVVLGDADVYPHSGGQYEWDSAAPVAVAAAAGLHVSRLDGSPLVYNRPDPYLPDLLISRRELAERAIAAAAGGAGA
jgi:3'(2'), 5'-bisphosphate nucleotidase